MPLTRELGRRRDLLVDGLRAAGLEPLVPQGGYFVVADAAPIGVSDAMAWCLEIPQRLGVAAVPVSAFCESPAGVESLVRFAFCKSEDRIREGTARLRA